MLIFYNHNPLYYAVHYITCPGFGVVDKAIERTALLDSNPTNMGRLIENLMME